MREFQLAIAEVWSSQRSHVIVVFKDEFTEEQLRPIPELQTFWKTNLCIKYYGDRNETAAKIR